MTYLLSLSIYVTCTLAYSAIVRAQCLNLDSCLQAAQQLQERQQLDKAAQFKLYDAIAKEYYYTGQPKRSIQFMRKAVSIGLDSLSMCQSSRILAACYETIGVIDSAYFYSYKSIACKYMPLPGIWKPHYNFAILLQGQGEYTEALEQIEMGLLAAQYDQQESRNKAIAVLNTVKANCLNLNNSPSELIEAAHQEIIQHTPADDSLGLYYALTNIGTYHSLQQNYGKAIHYKQKALSYIISQRSSWHFTTKTNIADDYNRLKDYTNAARILQSIEPFVNEINNIEVLTNYHDIYAVTLSGQQKHQAANEKLRLYAFYKDSLFNFNKIEAINQLRTEYQTNEALLKADNLEKANQVIQRNHQITKLQSALLGLALLLVVIASIFLIYTYRQRLQKRRDQIIRIKADQKNKLLEMLQNHETQILSAQMNAQNEERARIARSLHDGIGNQLATIKLFVSNLGKYMPDDAKSRWSNSTQMIDDACQEVREISHAFSEGSEAVQAFNERIKELQESLNSTGVLQINVALSPIGDNLPVVLNNEFYAITRECIQNIIKHADAQKVLIELQQDNGNCILTIQDDGKGFDTTQKSLGIGLRNMQTRCEKIRGEMTINSTPGHGSIFRFTTHI